MLKNLFKKRIDDNIYAPLTGKVILLEDVDDVTFSSKLLGDGLAIIPTETRLYSPVDGEISVLFPTSHAIGIKRSDGLEILIHIGIDTVESGGNGFEQFISLGSKVKKGDLLVEFDSSKMTKSFDLTTMIIITNSMNIDFDKLLVGEMVEFGNVILKRKIQNDGID